MEWLCLDFINSDCRDWRGSGERLERLTKPEWWQYFSQKWELGEGMPTDPDLIKALAKLRSQMRNVTEAVVAEKAPDQQDLDGINQVSASVPTCRQITFQQTGGFQAVELVLAEGWALIMGKIAASFIELLTGSDLRRLKICENQNCLWVYYDGSRNRSSRWCDDKTCGNLMKVRRFRERQKNREE
ncbi:CGNR zinc finger domain-containing protein [Brevibacillus ruminantium]|uniref:CGNR zinc finger domain-containing protein n=1 Tax=Brevibacillus ruminantium TaxID=2950604 RepID=A0ABY4WBV6_9BACL|nr:CGNR zinc finger domain-containing protein [Brevibacillus ruminantium]USG64663.1 CGNR zinc finger domain-containing protein [Brevibacillus ruminantium]